MTETGQPWQGKRVDVLDKGWIELQDVMGDDNAVVAAARASFLGESKGSDRDKKLLFYLLRHRHTTPFEMVEFKFRVRAPVVVWWQWVRHRTWNFNAQCLSGDTEVMFDKPETRRKGGFRVGSKLKLKDLYRRWNTWERERLRSMHLRTMDEETMMLSSARIGDVVYAGVKSAFRVILRNGQQITCSTDHRFLFESGWATLADATGLKLSGSRAVWRTLPALYVNGKPLETANLYTDADWLRYQYHTRRLAIAQIADLAGCSSHTIRKYLRVHGLTSAERSHTARFQSGDSPWNTGLSYSLAETTEENLLRRQRAARSVARGEASNLWKGGVASKRAHVGRWTTAVAPLVFERDRYRCAACSGLAQASDPFHAHHIVPVWADPSRAFDLENLITLHESCHRDLHRLNRELEFARSVSSGAFFPIDQRAARTRPRVRPNGHATPVLEAIESIEYVGEQDMFDLVVDGPFPNFVANWFIVHNSGRYTPFQEEDFYQVTPDGWRLQAADNKQASEGTLEDGAWLSEALARHYEEGYRLYQQALEAGIAREQARLFLAGFGVYYTWVAKIDAHNLMHFLSLRMANDAQFEIREYAWAIYEHFFKPALPWTAEAFEQFVLAPAGVVKSE